MHLKNNIFLLSIFIFFLVLSIILGYYLLATQNGSYRLCKLLLELYVEPEELSIEKVEGNLVDTLSLHSIVIKNPRYLPPDSVIKIQQLDIAVAFSRLKDIYVGVYNGRLMLPNSDTFLFFGECRKESVELKVYCRQVSAREMLDLFVSRDALKTVSGMVRDVDLHIIGTLNALAMEGKFFVEKITNESFSIVDCPGSVLLYCNNIKKAIRLDGEIIFEQGQVFGRNTAKIKLDKSAIVYEGSYRDPHFNIRGQADVEDVKINVVLQGTTKEPELKVSSYPPLTQDLLLVMLATDRSWGGAQTSIEQGKISADLVKDFLDYFIFSGKGEKVGQRFGITSLSFIYESETKGVGVKTSFKDRVGVSYKVQPPDEETGKQTSTHTVGTEVKITNTVSIAAEKEINKISTDEEQEEKESTEEKVYLQFKKPF